VGAPKTIPVLTRWKEQTRLKPQTNPSCRRAAGGIEEKEGLGICALQIKADSAKAKQSVLKSI